MSDHGYGGSFYGSVALLAQLSSAVVHLRADETPAPHQCRGTVSGRGAGADVPA